MSATHVLDRSAADPDRVLRYAPGETGLVDVYSPRSHPRGLVVLVHGGFWRAAYDRRHLRPLAEALAVEGWRVALPEYRRVGDPGGGWPGSLDDVVEALEFAPRELGFAAESTVVAGHSAGGHLAVLASTRTSSAPARVVSLAGVLDLGAALRDRLSDGAAAAFLGTADPPADVLAAADPMVAPLPRGVVVMHGDRDTAVPVEYSRDYASRDERVGLTILTGVDHFAVIDPLSDAYPHVIEALGGR